MQPLTSTQQAGIQNTNSAAGMAQPYFQTGTGFALAGAQPVNAAPLDTSSYLNPYIQSVLGATAAQINQTNQQAMSGQTGNAMSQGYFGGDRAGIAAAVLQGQQQLAAGQTYSGILSDAYQQAQQAAMQQQGVGLAAAQANRQALQQTGDTLANLGTGAQGAALSGAQAQLGAGQVEQQTGQAGLTALYNQFLQQQSYPFQTAQFLANIAEGTGALSGSTTQTTQPQSIFSDERLKEDMVPVGVGFDGANIYRFRYRGDPTTRVGFSAQEMEELHPEAVSTHPSGFKMVDYDKATRAAAGFALAANDDWPDEPQRMARAAGGRVGRQAGGMSGWGMYPAGSNPMVIQQLLESQAQMYAPYSGEGGPGLYGHSASQIPHGGQGYVPQASLPVGQLQVAHPPPPPQTNDLGSDIHAAASFADDAEGLSKDYHLAHQGFDWLKGKFGGGGGGDNMTGPPNANGGRIGRAPGGMTSADYAKQAAMYAARAKIHAQAAAARRDMLQRQASDQSVMGQIRNAVSGVNPFVGAGFDAGTAAAPFVDRTLGHIADTLSGGANNWVNYPMWGPGQQGAEAGVGAGRAAAAQIPNAMRAAAIQHHHQQAAAHAQAALDLSAPTAAPTGQSSPNLAGAHDLPSNIGTPVPINVGDVSHLQTGFAPANLTPYHQGLFSRIGDWLGGHFGSDAQRMAYDARGMTPDSSPAPIQSEAFQNAPNLSQPIQSEAFQGRAPPSAPAVAVAAPTSTEPIRSQAFADDSALHPVAINHDVDLNPQLAARGGFARADGGAAKNPWHAEDSGDQNLSRPRAYRQAGGPSDLSNPQNDNPYATQGPGLNIPTAETQHPKLATAQPVGGGQQGGLGQAIGMGSDIANIGMAMSKFLPFIGLQTGGRAGYADGGGPPAPDDDTLTPAPPVHDATATPAAAAADDDTAAAPPPAKKPGFGGAAPPGGGGGGGFGGLLSNLIGTPLHLLGEAAGYEGNGKFDRDRLMPFLSAIGAIGATPTVHPLFALSQGLGAYGKSYMAQQQQEAQIAQEQAQAGVQRKQALPESLQGMVEVPGALFNPDGSIDSSRTHMMSNGHYAHWGLPTEVMGGGGGGANMQTQQGPISAAGAPAARGPINANYQSGTFAWSPSATSDRDVAGLAPGLDVSGGTGAAIRNQALISMNPALKAQEQASQAEISKNEGVQQGAITNATNLRMLGQAINSIPPGGLAAMGENYDGRQQLVRIIQTARRMAGLGDDDKLNADMTPADIIGKINALAGTSMAHSQGQHSAEIASALRSILPSGGSSNPAAANEIIASLMTQNQQDLDFGRFAKAYTAKYGTSIGVSQAFQDEMTPIYGQERATLQKMLARNGRPMSIAEYIQKNPSRLKDLEQGFGGASGWGVGIGRYFPGGV